jgi:hypothetical protein
VAISWSTFRQQIRDTVLQDSVPDEESGEFKYTNAELLVYCGWALDAFADHTAVATATAFDLVTDQDEYDLPENLFEDDPVDITLTVFTTESDGTRAYLDPIRYSEIVRLDNGEGFYVTNDNKLKITKEDLGDATVLNLWYYAYYNAPVADSDPLPAPRWARTALSYLIAAHALSGESLKTATIRQYNARPDTGQPEHNPLAKQQERYLKMYREEIAKHDAQQRTNHERYTEQ